MKTFDEAPKRLRTEQTCSSQRRQNNLLETKLESQQQTAIDRVHDTHTRLKQLDMTKTMPPTRAPMCSAPYRAPNTTAGDEFELRHATLQSQPGWQVPSAESVRHARSMPISSTSSVVPRLHLTKGFQFDPTTQRRCLTERVAPGWTSDNRPLSKRLEHRLREKFNKVEGGSGISDSPNRVEQSAGRWQRLDYKWKEGDRARQGKSVPVHCASIVKTKYATREFRSDSIFSADRRPDDLFNATRTRGNYVMTGGVPIQDTSAKCLGNFFGAQEVERPCTAGIRVNAWNYHWQNGPTAIRSSRA